jgi:ferric-dicitrate binding protein FerR (iron transport regulator)
VAEEFSEADVEVAWQRFRVAANLAPAPAAEPAPTKSEDRVVPLWPAAQPWLRVAAAILLLLGVWSLLRFFLPLGKEEMVTVAAGAERQQTTLPDGSKVWVNRHSTLSYAASFNEKAREVQLQGEAFFEVKKDHGRPFTVLANETRTQVLGGVCSDRPRSFQPRTTSSNRLRLSAAHAGSAGRNS